MKSLVNKFLTLVICTSALVMAAATVARAQLSSQLEEKNLPVGAFSTVNVTDDFEVTLVKGAYSVRLTADRALAPYVQVYVRSKVLYIDYDQKAVPKDLQKQYKGKNAPEPVFRAVVYLPELNGLEISDNAVVMSTDEFYGNAFSLSMTDKAQLKNLNIKVQSATISMKKNAQAILGVNAFSKVDVEAEGNSGLKLYSNTAELNVKASGSANLTISGESNNFALNTGGSSKVSASLRDEKASFQLGGSSNVTIGGGTDSLELRTEKNTNLDAKDYVAREVNAVMTDGEAHINVTEQLKVSISGGSVLNYSGTPAIQIERVIKSTLAPEGTSTK